MNYVIAEHPTEPHREGELVLSGARLAFTRLESIGAVLLPVDVRALSDWSLGGYVRRGWGGDNGWSFDRLAGERGCPMAIQIGEGIVDLHWAVRFRAVAPDAVLDSVRLVADTGTPSAVSAGLTVVENAKRAAPVLPENTLVRGVSRCQSAASGFLALRLHVVARGVVACWSAVSTFSAVR